MGYADGYYYGQGRIICDTSTFSVGDTIRVRSMTDSSKVWNQQVATVGTALVFTVPCYDYYKICTVQTINDTPTEIGGVYRTVDYGQTLFINVLDKTTLGGVKGILNAHQHNNLMSVGDEVTLTIDGASVVFQDAGHDLYVSNEIVFVAKNVHSKTAFGSNYYVNSALRGVAQSIYGLIDSNDRQYINDMTREAFNSTNVFETYTDKIWIPSLYEVNGTSQTGVSPSIPQYQFPLFLTQANRIKTFEGTASDWWTSDSTYNSGSARVGVLPNGNTSGAFTYSNTTGVVPCFHIVADS